MKLNVRHEKKLIFRFLRNKINITPCSFFANDVESHYNKNISKRLFHNWKIHLKEKKLIADSISRHNTYFVLANIFFRWRHKAEEIQNTMRIRENRIRIIGHRLIRMWAMHKWTDFVNICRKEREINDLVAHKWTQVRRWL